MNSMVESYTKPAARRPPPRSERLQALLSVFSLSLSMDAEEDALIEDAAALAAAPGQPASLPQAPLSNNTQRCHSRRAPTDAHTHTAAAPERASFPAHLVTIWIRMRLQLGR